MDSQKKPIVLIVDDEPSNLAVLGRVLKGAYEVRAANSGANALVIAAAVPRPDLILLDVLMPDMDGFHVLETLRAQPQTREIPVIFVTALQEIEDEQLGFNLGAMDYITKPIRSSIVLARVGVHIELARARQFLQQKNEWLESEVDKRMRENQIIQDVSIRALAHLAETRDPETGDHINRTQAYIRLLAEKLADHPRFSATINDSYINMIAKSAPLHDIGKVGIPDHILLKPGRLTAEEWVIMQTHAAIGARAIEYAERDVDHSVVFLDLAKEIAHWHHERWDGSGYPDGLAEEGIPLSARLMALADVFDALVSQRVYKPAMPFDQARDLIVAERGRQFDPLVVDAFIGQYERFLEVAKRYDGGTQCP